MCYQGSQIEKINIEEWSVRTWGEFDSFNVRSIPLLFLQIVNKTFSYLCLSAFLHLTASYKMLVMYWKFYGSMKRGQELGWHLILAVRRCILRSEFMERSWGTGESDSVISRWVLPWPPPTPSPWCRYTNADALTFVGFRLLKSRKKLFSCSVPVSVMRVANELCQFIYESGFYPESMVK